MANEQISAYDMRIPYLKDHVSVKYERLYMNRIRYKTNYRLVLGYVVLSAVLVGLFCLFMSINEDKYLPIGLALLGIWLLSTVALLMTIPKTRERELTEELARYDFSEVPAPADMEFAGMQLAFSKDGLSVDGKFYWYGHLQPKIVTSNRFLRVWVALRLGTVAEYALYLPLSSEVIAAIKDYEIPLENPDDFVFLLGNKKKAFYQIYQSGKICALKTI